MSIEGVHTIEGRETVATSVEQFNRALDRAVAGQNVGLLLRGVKSDQIQRGQVVAAPRSLRPRPRFRGEGWSCRAITRRWTGIKAPSAARDTPEGVFCMPSLPDRFATHQWLRELKRRGQRTIVAVDFRLPSDEPVWVGRYQEGHQEMPLGRAIGVLRREVDSRGFEVELLDVRPSDG